MEEKISTFIERLSKLDKVSTKEDIRDADELFAEIETFLTQNPGPSVTLESLLEQQREAHQRLESLQRFC